MSHQRFLAAFVTGLVFSTGATPAFPQSAGTGPAAPADRQQSLTVSATVAQAYDDDVPLELGGAIDPSGLDLGGHSTMLTGDADYSWRMGQLRAGASAASSLRYYSSADEFRALSHNAGVRVSAPLSRRTSLFLNQTASYSPSYLFGLFPQDASASPAAIQPISPDYLLDDFESISYGTTVTISQALSRRNSLSVSGDAARTRFVQESARRRNLRTYTIQGRFSRSLARNASLNAGYRYKRGDFGHVADSGATDESTEHTIDVGINYSRPLSPTRRLTFGSAIGSSIVRLPEPNQRVPGPVGGQYRQLSGHLSTSYQLGRSWLARGTFRRSVEYIAGLTEPVLADGWSANVAGFLTRRLDVTSSVGFSSGSPVVSRSSLVFDTYTGNVKLRYALKGPFAAFAEYLYYFYDFRESERLAPTIPLGLERNGVRAGLTLRVSIP